MDHQPPEEAPRDEGLRRSVQQKWPQLTAEDLLLLGAKDAFIARLQQRTGGDPSALEREFDELRSSLDLDRRHAGVIHLTAG